MNQHNCFWPGCTKVVSDDLWGCARHWYILPRKIREAIYAAYRPGQCVADWTDEYRKAFEAAQEWIAMKTTTSEEAASP